MRLEIKHLRLVRSISETANLTRAAELLFISQPALSKQLAELESRLGFALFYRTRKAMLPTEAGQAFNSHAQRILGDVAVLEDYLARYGKGDAGRLRLGIDRLHRADWLPGWLQQMRQRFPHVQVQVKQVPDLLLSLRQKECDLAIVGEVSAAAEIDFQPLRPDEMVLITPPAHPLASLPWLEVADLAGVDLLYHFELEQSYLYRRYLYPQQIQLGSLQPIQDVPAIIALVRAGVGVSLLPRRLLDGDEQGLKVLAIGEQGFHFNWYVAVDRGDQQGVLRQALQLLQGL
ncbi:LysR family transcriptional regulator [Pseudomonas sp.]|uniref:LysR family transcriptional regulator n=1 Tax=Pseudomonas sp. TaxID=306 RepID=UPI002732FEFE|nr:LysR family transcriptional regulator [Pseudomonas sp.]MDP3815568.1 LysR family transcriptional regulator [Pseudomonas sp.]